MTPEEKAIGIAALRSGKYTQCRRLIGNQPQRHLCCIGVMADANGITSLVDTRQACDFLGLTQKQIKVLIEMNDHQHKSFLEIANYVEANF